MMWSYRPAFIFETRDESFEASNYCYFVRFSFFIVHAYFNSSSIVVVHSSSCQHVSIPTSIMRWCVVKSLERSCFSAAECEIEAQKKRGRSSTASICVVSPSDIYPSSVWLKSYHPFRKNKRTCASGSVNPRILNPYFVLPWPGGPWLAIN